MGINGLWQVCHGVPTVRLQRGISDLVPWHLWFSQVLEPAARAVPIISLALQDRYVGPGPHSPYVVGIDARLVAMHALSALELSSLLSVRGLSSVSKADGTVLVLRQGRIPLFGHSYSALLDLLGTQCSWCSAMTAISALKSKGATGCLPVTTGWLSLRSAF